MSKKQYVDRRFGRSGNFERVVELYEDGVLQKRRKYIEYDQAVIRDRGNSFRQQETMPFVVISSSKIKQKKKQEIWSIKRN